MLQVINISKSYNNIPILKDINLHINKSEIVSILGPSGIGKSTLFNIIAGIDSPDSGNIILNSQDITSTIGNLGYMPQNDLLLPYKNIIDNVTLPLKINGINKKDAYAKALPLFKIFNLEGCEYKYPDSLSGGMRQRAAFLRTYLCYKKIFLLDEPFSALDNITKSKLHLWYLSLIKKLNVSTIFITHDIDEALFLSDRIYILKGNPARISDEIKIYRPKVNKEDFLLSDEFIEKKRFILSVL